MTGVPARDDFDEVEVKMRMSEWANGRIGEWVNRCTWRCYACVACMSCWWRCRCWRRMDGLTISVNKQMGYNMGSQIQGTFKIRVRGPENLVSVAFWIDGEVTRTTLTGAPFDSDIQTGDYDPGWHEVAAVGTTADGRHADSRSVEFPVRLQRGCDARARCDSSCRFWCWCSVRWLLSAIVPLLTGRKIAAVRSGRLTRRRAAQLRDARWDGVPQVRATVRHPLVGLEHQLRR